MRKIITIFCFLVFAFAAIFYIIPVTLFYRVVWPNNEARKLRMHEILCNFFRWCARHIPGVEISADLSEEKFRKPAIIIANHQSHLDLLAILILSPKIVAMTNRWVWRFPLYAPVIRYLEYYPAADGLENSETKIKSLLDRGYSIVIFPEGTRSAENRILKFHRGAFYLAEKLGADLIPIYLDGTGRVLPKKDLTICPGKITVEIGERIAADDVSMGNNYREKTRAWHKHYLKWENTNIERLQRLQQ